MSATESSAAVRPSEAAVLLFFEGWPEADLVAVAACLRRVSYRAGEEIFAEKSPGDSLYFISDGTVEIYRRHERMDDTIALLHTGVTFGEMTLLDGSPRSAAARAVTPCAAFAFDRAAYARLCAEHPASGVRFLDGLLHILVERLRQADYNIAVLYTAVKEL